MQLTSHTDYALRTLMVLGLSYPAKVRTVDICEAFEISDNHLAKVVQTLAHCGYVLTSRGKDGGVRLGRAPEDINIGEVVRNVESDLGVVPCLRAGGQECFITPVCSLMAILRDATERFVMHLDQFSLSDLLKGMGSGPEPLRHRLVKRLPMLG